MRLRDKEPYHRVHLAEGDITQLPFANNSCDAVVAVHIFHLVPNWQIALQEASRVLKLGAYLLHGNNGQTPRTDILWNALDEAYPAHMQRDIGVRLNERTEFLLQAGWQIVGEPLIHSFTVEHSPQQFVDNIRNRIWSRLWRLSDEELNVCVEAVQTAIKENFDDPNKRIAVENTFEIRTYLPPESESQ
jgi:SAM-dependent methyltransferase